jgi:hypothetical protein
VLDDVDAAVLAVADDGVDLSSDLDVAEHVPELDLNGQDLPVLGAPSCIVGTDKRAELGAVEW